MDNVVRDSCSSGNIRGTLLGYKESLQWKLMSMLVLYIINEAESQVLYKYSIYTQYVLEFQGFKLDFPQRYTEALYLLDWVLLFSTVKAELLFSCQYELNRCLCACSV